MRKYHTFITFWIGLSVASSGGCASRGRTRRIEMTDETATGEAKVEAPHIRFLDPDHAPVGPGWVSLFDGEDTRGWHKRDEKRDMSWRIADRILSNAPAENKQGVDLITDEKFWNFEAYYEYRVPKGSNSGFYLRGRYEIQIYDSFGKPAEAHGNGSIYGYKAVSKNTSRAPDQWQSVYAKIVGNKVTVVLNGEKVIDEYEVKNATGMELDHDYDKPGPIFLQGDHGKVDFRYIYVRPLEK